MTAREFNDLLKKAGLGYVKLEKTYENEGDNTVYSYVLDNSGQPLNLYGTHHTYEIDINDSTYGQTWEGPITDATYDIYEICDLQFYTPNWAYPEVGLSIGDIDINDNCGIRLTSMSFCHNVPNQIDAYAEKAIEAYKNPEEYQAWLLEEFVKEYRLLIVNHLGTLKSKGFKQIQNDIFKRGFADFYESVLGIEFQTGKGTTSFLLLQNLFTGRINFSVWDKESRSVYGETWRTEYNINDVSTEFLEDVIERKFEATREYFWRTHSLEDINDDQNFV